MHQPNAPVVDGLIRWLEQEHGGSVALVEPVVSKGEGFDSTVLFVRLAGAALPDPWREPLVLRVKADADRTPEAEREAEVQGWMADRGYPAPRVLRVFAAGELVDVPVQVMERAPGVLLIDRVKARPWRARSLCGQLAEAHVDLHAVPSEGFPAGDDLLEQRLRLPHRVCEELDDDALRRGLEQVETLEPTLRDFPVSVCHGDYHPLNVLVSGAVVTVIDWTDAGLGDRHGDIARTQGLLDLAELAAGNGVERRVLRIVGPWFARTYRRAYERRLGVDPSRIALWMPVQLLHGWAQARALHAGLFDRGDDAVDERIERVPAHLVAELERRFEAAMDEARDLP
jgi:aminoglycoside phosphotransferase (APT) family kinase protein